MAGDGQHAGKQRVLIAGGGVAGIEAALVLRDLAGGRAKVDVRDPGRGFVFRPFAVGEPYGTVLVFRYDLGRLAERCGASFRPDGIVSVDPRLRLAVSRDGERIRYDHLIVANGARMLWSVQGAVTFWGAADEGRVGDVIGALRAGQLRNLVFTMPGGHSWVLPLYELALLGAAELAKGDGKRTRLTIVTPEGAPLETFGQSTSERMGKLLEERGIEVLVGARPVKFDHGWLQVAPIGRVAADAVISLPRLEGRRMAGIPHDPNGFVGVDEHGRVIGLDDVYAAGDVTSFPVKQAGAATQQADAVAEAIAAAVGAAIEPRVSDPILHGDAWESQGAIGRYLSPLIESLAVAAESDFELDPAVESTSHG